MELDTFATGLDKVDVAFTNPRVVNLKPFRRVSMVASLLMFAGVISTLIWFSTQASNIQLEVKEFFSSTAMQIVGMVSMAWLAFLGTLVMSPPKVVFVGFAGFLFGYPAAVAIAWAAALCARLLTYWLARDALLDSIATICNNYPHFKKGLVPILASHPVLGKIKLILMLRFSSSLFPDTLLNYAIALAPSVSCPLWILTIAFHTSYTYTLYAFWGATLDGIARAIYLKEAPEGLFYLVAFTAVIGSAVYFTLSRLSNRALNSLLEQHRLNHPELAGPAPPPPSDTRF